MWMKEIKNKTNKYMQQWNKTDKDKEHTLALQQTLTIFQHNFIPYFGQ
jgi:hypothetical protein